MTKFETVTLTRDCDATIVPSGEKTSLPKGARAHITQSLGGTFTVMTEQGYMVRVEGKDADAIGKEVSVAHEKVENAGEAKSLEDSVWDQLKTCYDPEIPVDIVELGLVYECVVEPIPDQPGKSNVRVKMTLTAPGCGMGESIRMDAKQKIEKLPEVGNAEVDLVWEPQWDREMMSEAAKLKLGMM